jgi:hypothetical protein
LVALTTVRTEPHPRFYTDTTDTVLVAVPTLLRTELSSRDRTSSIPTAVSESVNNVAAPVTRLHTRSRSWGVMN